MEQIINTGIDSSTLLAMGVCFMVGLLFTNAIDVIQPVATTLMSFFYDPSLATMSENLNITVLNNSINMLEVMKLALEEKLLRNLEIFKAIISANNILAEYLSMTEFNALLASPTEIDRFLLLKMQPFSISNTPQYYYLITHLSNQVWALKCSRMNIDVSTPPFSLTPTSEVFPPYYGKVRSPDEAVIKMLSDSVSDIQVDLYLFTKKLEEVYLLLGELDATELLNYM